MSSLIFSASITLILLSILSPSTADLVDIDGDRIVNGNSYYIIPITTPTSTTGLTYSKNEGECPVYITKEKTENSPGTPVIISSSAGIGYISLDESVSFIFRDFTLCQKIPKWGITINRFKGRLYIGAGGDNSLDSYPFSITNKDSSKTSTYELKYGSDASLGLFEDDGLLGFAENPTMVSFKKAGYFLELSTS